MKQSLTKTLFFLGIALLIALAFPASALADVGEEGGLELSQTINGYTITLVFISPPVIGENPIHVLVVDNQGLPVANAIVEVGMAAKDADHKESSSDSHEDAPVKPTSMPAKGHGAMPAKDEPAIKATAAPKDNHDETADPHEEMEMIVLEAGHEGGEYTGIITIPDSGEWDVRVHLTVASELTEIEFPLTIERSFTGAGFLTGFALLNAVILFVAAIFKSNRA